MTEQEVLAIKSTEGLQRLQPADFKKRNITPSEISHIFSLCDAFWMHSGNPAYPHAELTSGKCSNGFIDCMRALHRTNICRIMAEQAVRKLRRRYDFRIDWVIGSAYAAIDFSKDVANVLGANHGFTEKGEDKNQLWQRLVIEKGETVLQAEELMTTAGTAQAVRQGIEQGNLNPVLFAPYILVLVHRSDASEVDGTPVLYLVHYDIWMAEPEECLLCAAGSRRLRPKQNWAELTGKGYPHQFA